jgi:hypothetical protein
MVYIAHMLREMNRILSKPLQIFQTSARSDTMAARFLITFLSLLPLSFCTPAPPHPQLPLPARTVAQLATSPTWLENIAVRSSGDLLVNQLAPAPVLYTISNPTSPSASLEPIYTWHAPNVTDLLGITETYPDTFAIIAGNATANATGYPGTWSVWEVAFPSPKSSSPSVKKLANIPAAQFLNGVIPLPGRPDILLIPDSQFGLLFRLDTRTGKHEISDRTKPLDSGSTACGSRMGICTSAIRT